MFTRPIALPDLSLGLGAAALGSAAPLAVTNSALTARRGGAVDFSDTIIEELARGVSSAPGVPVCDGSRRTGRVAVIGVSD